MSDPADKSDDLIAELAKLMAAPAGKDTAVQPVGRSAPLDPAATSPGPVPVRIPGLDSAPRPSPVAAAVPQAEPRAPATGSIRIPGMDQPAPVSTSAPVGKFDFGKPIPAAPIRQEPLSSLTERLAAQSPSPASAAPRVPSNLSPVSENRSFAEGPSLSVSKPAVPAQPASDFSFDFGFAQNPPSSAAPPRPIPQPQAGPPPVAAAPADPIAALIEADLADAPEDSPSDAAEDHASPPPPPPVAPPVLRTVSGQAQPSRPVLSPVNPGAPRPASNAPIPLKPVSVASRAPETDRFAISPGVGLNMKPASGQPLSTPVLRAPDPVPERDDSDPMSEIENLIGEAVRVELTPGPVKVQTATSVAPQVELEPEEELEREIATHPDAAPAAPVVPPLTTQFAPRRANIKEDTGSRSAEDAILAAAAASGAEVGRMEPSVASESPYRRLKVKPERSSFFSGGVRQYIGMAVAGTLLLAAGLGLYWVLGMGRTASTTGANAPQLTADTTQVKQVPTATPKAQSDTAKSPVLAKIDGASSAASTEQLVSTEQSTADVTRDVTPAADDGESGLANRKVRTVTVRPDGTIVSGDDAVAGGEALPVDRPNVPTVPSTEATNLLGNSDATSAAPAPLVPDTTGTASSAPVDAQVAEASPVIDPTVVAPVPMQFPVRSAASKPAASLPTNTSVNALTGAQTPNGQIDLLGGGNTTAQQPVQVATTQPAASTGGSAPAYVQLSSQPSAEDAQASIKAMTARYGSLFGGNKLTVQQVDLGQKGVRWRVRLPAASLADASNICAQIKAQGGDCFATNG